LSSREEEAAEFLTGRCGTVRITKATARSISALKRGASSEPLRLLYASVTDHVIGSFEAWKRGVVDPYAPAVSYSTQLLDLADAVGAELAMVCPGETDSEMEHHLGIGLARFAAAETSGGAAGFYRRQRRTTAHIRHLAERFAADAVIFSLGPFWPGLSSYPCPVVVSFHNNPWRPDRRAPGLREGTKLALAGAALRSDRIATVAVSEVGARQVEALSGGRQKPIVSMTQAKDLATFPPSRQQRTETLLYVGRIEEAKGVFDLLQAALALKPLHPALRLRFLGSGGAEARLRQEVARNEAEPWVTVEGWQEGEAVGAAMAEAACLVCPTRSSFLEGRPRVIHEAHQAGCPVIASSVAPSRAEESTLVFPADDREALRLTIGRFLSDPGLRESLEEGALGGREVYKDRRLAWGSRVAEALAELGQRKRPEGV
jgi:glycosyltransferase involved in cell wall biosynthesis